MRMSEPFFYRQKNTWYVWKDGKRVSLKVQGEGNEAEAIQAWHNLMASQEPVKRVRNVPDTSREQETVSLTLSELVEAFLSDAEGRVKPESYRGYAKFLRPFAATNKKLNAATLTIAIVERYSRRSDWSQSYRCGFIGTVVSMVRWAVDAKRLNNNPIAGIKKPKKQSRGRKAIITPEDHAKLVQHARGDFKEFLQLLWLTGARPGEIAALTSEHVELTSKAIILTEHKTADQTGKDRLIFLTEEAVTILKRLIEQRPEGLLFPNTKGEQLTANQISTRMFRLCERAGVKAFCYGYRHSVATSLLASGVPDAHVAAILGHQGTTTLHRHYSHLVNKTDVLRDALKNIKR